MLASPARLVLRSSPSAPGLSLPRRGMSDDLFKRRKNPAGLPQKNRLLVSNSKISSRIVLLMILSSGGSFVGCLLRMSRAITLPREWAIRCTLPVS